MKERKQTKSFHRVTGLMRTGSRQRHVVPLKLHRQSTLFTDEKTFLFKIETFRRVFKISRRDSDSGILGWSGNGLTRRHSGGVWLRRWRGCTPRKWSRWGNRVPDCGWGCGSLPTEVLCGSLTPRLPILGPRQGRTGQHFWAGNGTDWDCCFCLVYYSCHPDEEFMENCKTRDVVHPETYKNKKLLRRSILVSKRNFSWNRWVTLDPPSFGRWEVVCSLLFS